MAAAGGPVRAMRSRPAGMAADSSTEDRCGEEVTS
jgi:hypothetical protein